ncbi:MAG: ribonuclease H-like domain-containing protein [Candidatus Marinimicrobia bacterium]|nr:ribonuclease H-like domain-containing protein [Candidatus Neomarinimicrobiota bacterium]
MDIRDRLELKFKERKINSPKFETDSSPKNVQKTQSNSDISKYVTGTYIPTKDGDIFVARHSYELDHLHGNFPLSILEKIEGKDLQVLGNRDQKINFNLRKTLFLDTETTGLAGGTGTSAFLIGIGFFYENKYIVEQYFMRDYIEESPMLRLIAEKAEDYDLIVTFNGRSFDLPLLETRMIMNRIDPVFNRLHDLDLLHPARRIWGLSLENCRLGTLEEEVLGFERTEDDLPSALIPDIYFDYVKFGDADPLYKVFYHNEKDVVSMVGLLFKEYKFFNNPLNDNAIAPLDLYSMGRYFERMRDYTMAQACMEKASPKLDGAYRRDSLIRLSMIHKREKRWADAVGIWKDFVSNEKIFNLSPYVELAKFYEHKAKKYETALRYSNEALGRMSNRRENDLTALRHRIFRLENKIKRIKEK